MATTPSSRGSLPASQASQSERVVGNSPIEFTFHMPTARATSCIATYASLTCSIFALFVSVSKRSKAWFVARSPAIGFLKAIKTIMMLKICSEFPVMYIMMAVMGKLLMGASATSQAFLSFSVSISSGVACLRGWIFVSFEVSRFFVVSSQLGLSRSAYDKWGLHTFEPEVCDGKPGGSGMPPDLDLCAGGEARSDTHLGTSSWILSSDMIASGLKSWGVVKLASSRREVD